METAETPVDHQSSGGAALVPTPQHSPATSSEATAAHEAALARRRWSATLRSRLLTIGEILIIVVVSGAFVAPYLNFNLVTVPAGREFLSAIQSHHVWSRVQECGLCGLWNGNLRGGAPAFAEVYGSPLHPLVVLTTLLFGVINGAKLALAGAFLMAGLAQWWLGQVIGLGRVARLWMAIMAVVAGNLSGRMEIGTFGLVLSTAACALVLPPLVALLRTGSRRSAVLLGIMLALAILAGQGYLQIGLLVSLLAVLVLWPWDRQQAWLMLRRFALAGGLALLLAAPLLVPVLHFLPNFAKELDYEFVAAQPFLYILLNLVINDPDYFQTELLDKLSFPYLYINYIGWIPVLLALGSFFTLRSKDDWRLAIFFVLFAGLAIWTASAGPLRWLVEYSPLESLREFAAGVRSLPVIAGLAVPPILALAGLGLDRLLKANWPRLRLGRTTPDKSRRAVSINLRWVLVVPLLLAISSAWSFGRLWVYTVELPPGITFIVDALHTPDVQWVNPPFGEHAFAERAMRANLKMSAGIRPWNWRDRPFPEPVLEADRHGVPSGMHEEPVEVVDQVPIYAAPSGREYARVTHSEGSRTVCRGRGSGGNIDVICDLPQAGTLTVIENQWTGWQAHLNGQALEIDRAQHWLTVDLPAGEHTVTFRYRPWDIWIGVGLSVAGVILAVWYWRRDGKSEQPSENEISA